MLTPGKRFQHVWHLGRKKQTIQCCSHESNHISTSIFFFNAMSGKASVTLIWGHSVISLSTKPLSEPLHTPSCYLGPSHHSFGLKSDATWTFQYIFLCIKLQVKQNVCQCFLLLEGVYIFIKFQQIWSDFRMTETFLGSIRIHPVQCYSIKITSVSFALQ